MFRSDRAYLAFALLTLTTAGCGSSPSTPSNGGSTTTTSTSTSTTSTSATTSTSSTPGYTGYGPITVPVEACTAKTVMAVSKLYFGDGNAGQWMNYGFNLDGKVSTASSTDLCMLNDGAMASDPYPDGNNGIDNSFGKNLLPVIIALDNTWVTDVNNGIQAGNFTVLLEMDCLPVTGDAGPLTTKMFAGETLGSTPKWDGTDMWPVEPDLLTNPQDPESSQLVYPDCSLKGTTFSTGMNGTFVITIPIMLSGISSSIKLTLYAAQLTMTLSADRTSATSGMLGGVLNTEELVGQVKNLGFLLNICGESVLTNLETAVRQASDILANGTQDTTQTCDGISFGLGFDMLPAQIGAVGPPVPTPQACP